jgi:hypothetical protein
MYWTAARSATSAFKINNSDSFLLQEIIQIHYPGMKDRRCLLLDDAFI